jgi:hypothetical protein
MINGSGVSSGKTTCAGMYGRNEAASGFSGLTPTLSGYSLVEAISRFAVSTVSVAIRPVTSDSFSQIGERVGIIGPYFTAHRRTEARMKTAATKAAGGNDERNAVTA